MSILRMCAQHLEVVEGLLDDVEAHHFGPGRYQATRYLGRDRSGDCYPVYGAPGSR